MGKSTISMAISKEYIEIDLHFSAPVYVTACGSPLSAVHVSEALRCASCPRGCMLSAAFSRFPWRGNGWNVVKHVVKNGKNGKDHKDPRICILIHVSLANIRYIVIVNLHCLRLVGSFELGLRCSALCDSVCKQKTWGCLCEFGMLW